jgi:1,4-dihydroxy-2-naphthoyl-CoA hydrolase
MKFDSYDPAVAEGIKAMGTTSSGGLPEFLGLRTTDVGPGTMVAELDVRPDLLNPFGTLHGGVLSALVDHLLGAVLYPLIPRGLGPRRPSSS